MQKHNCPICKTDLMPFERYPKYICESCAKKATDAKGRMVEFVAFLPPFLKIL
jgi:hypothetical protein